MLSRHEGQLQRNKYMRATSTTSSADASHAYAYVILHGGLGHVEPDDVKQQLPEPSSDHMIFVCGPPPMMNAISGVCSYNDSI
jgi:NAD(P)H-flavin reductase